MSTKPEPKFMTAMLSSTAYGIQITVQATGTHYSPDVMNDISGRLSELFKDITEHIDELEEASYEEQPAPNINVSVQEIVKPE